MFYKEEYLKFGEEFGNSKKMVLSTSFEDVVTSRIERWMYLDGIPNVETFDIKNEKYTLQPNGVETHVLLEMEVHEFFVYKIRKNNR